MSCERFVVAMLVTLLASCPLLGLVMALGPIEFLQLIAGVNGDTWGTVNQLANRSIGWN